MRYRLVASALVCFSMIPWSGMGSSHMDAPLITLDPAANSTDVYAFRSAETVGGATTQYLTTALAVYPFEEPGIGPNKYNFDPNVLYEIHVSLGSDVAAGKPSLSYQFRFTESYKNQNTILQSYLGVINSVDDENQNLTQRYSVTLVDHRPKDDRKTLLGNGVVPPNNQGIATPLYNTGNSGEAIAKAGVSASADLDPYTQQSIATLGQGHEVFCGQRDDGFYGDIQAIFDLLQLRAPGKDSQAGYNVHMIALNIPLDVLGGDQQSVGVYATTSRKSHRVLLRAPAPRGNGENSRRRDAERNQGVFKQIGRQGNPLFCEGFVPIADKDLYNRTSPSGDKDLFSQYAETPELARLINAIVFGGAGPAPETDRTDLAGIFIPDVIKVDLSTGPARLAGGIGFHRLSIFGGDTLTGMNGAVAGGWPNGRRFGDDVVDIGVSAVISDLRTSPPVIRVAGDNVDSNDITYNQVFPYAATPLNGRNHGHH